jgi:hypothetical protein
MFRDRYPRLSAMAHVGRQYPPVLVIRDRFAPRRTARKPGLAIRYSPSMCLDSTDWRCQSMSSGPLTWRRMCSLAAGRTSGTGMLLPVRPAPAPPRDVSILTMSRHLETQPNGSARGRPSVRSSLARTTGTCQPPGDLTHLQVRPNRRATQQRVAEGPQWLHTIASSGQTSTLNPRSNRTVQLLIDQIAPIRISQEPPSRGYR